jgi:ribosomal protein S18 acetylase RimI-like enzyme
LSFEIRSYTEADEQGWLRCRVLGFLDSAFHDDVRQEKEHYEGPAVELVAVADDQIVGLLDLELEPAPGVLHDTGARGGVIWHVAVHPDYRRRGIASALVERALELAREHGLEIVQAWTRDDDWVHRWYESRGFRRRYSYLHFYMQPEEAREEVTLRTDALTPVLAFAHYTGDDSDEIRARFRRVHDDVLFERAV